MFFWVWQWNAASIRSLLFISGTLFWGKKFSSFPSLASPCWHFLLVVFILILSCFLIIPEQSKIQRFITNLPHYTLFLKHDWLDFDFWFFFYYQSIICLWGKSWGKSSSGNSFPYITQGEIYSYSLLQLKLVTLLKSHSDSLQQSIWIELCISRIPWIQFKPCALWIPTYDEWMDGWIEGGREGRI